MNFEEDNSVEKFGENIGYIAAYFSFTTILYFVLTLAKKLPASWTYLHIMLITFSIVLVGSAIKRLLK